MVAITQERIERLKLMESLMPTDRDGERGLTVAELSGKLADELSHAPHVRTLQRDINDLCEEGRVRLLDSTEGANRYQRVSEVDEFDPVAWEYMLGQLKNELAGIVSARQLEAILTKLQLSDGGCGMDEHKLRIIPDSLRLQPAEIKPDVLASLLRGLADNRALRVVYEDRLGKRSEPVLHPQGLLQRGPQVYLYAMKNDEETERMYAVHRMVQVECLPIAARQREGFDLDQCIASGRADFAEGQVIQLKAIVRGYIETLLYECPLGPGQQMAPLDEEAEGSLLSIDMPGSGQLLRWILAGGENITVLEPVELREIVVGQVKNQAKHYQESKIVGLAEL